MTMRIWHLLPWASRFALLAGLASIIHLQVPGHGRPTLVIIYLCVTLSGVLGFREVLLSGGRMPQIAGLSLSERLILRTMESASMVAALMIMLGLT